MKRRKNENLFERVYTVIWCNLEFSIPTINGKSGIFEDGKFEGVIVKNKGHMMIDTPVYPYWLRIEKSKDEFYEDEKVIFTVKSKPNEKNPIAKVWYAINVKLKENE